MKFSYTNGNDVEKEYEVEPVAVMYKWYHWCNIKIRCKEYLSGTIVEEFDNGDFLYEIDVPENEHFWFGTVLALGAQVKVIEPPGLIDRICMNCNEILKRYEEV